ncbi:MAG: fimbrillin family protein [Phocaeicola sp.]
MSKRFLLPIVALALVISGCTKHDVLGHTDSEAADPTIVSFNASLASLKGVTTTKDSFKEFFMYAYQGAKGSDTSMSWGTDSPKPLMDSEKVTKGSNNAWQTASSTPWPAEGTHVQFFAFSPAASDASGIKYIKDGSSGHKPALGFTAKTDVADQVDLLYAQSTEMVTAATGKHNKVNLKFTHALTKVKFSAKVQPNQELYLSELSLHNLGQEGHFAYTTGSSTVGAWDGMVTENKAYAIELIDKAKTGITDTEALDVTTEDGATLVIPQTRAKVDVTAGGDAIFSTNKINSYIKIVYSLKNTIANSWIVGTGSTAAEQVTAYIPVDVAFNMNQLVNYEINFGTGNGGYNDGGNPIIDSKEMIQIDVKLSDWNAETTIVVTPPPLPMPDGGKMSFKVVPGGSPYRLPFTYSGKTGPYRLSVDWGDGSALQLIESGTSLSKGINHTYPSGSTTEYLITITSSEADFTKVQIPEIKSGSCKQIVSIETPLLNTGATSFREAFIMCENLKSLPSELFKYNTAVTGFESVFAECYSLKEIPSDIFKYNIAATDFEYAFSWCFSLEEIPSDLFEQNIAATSFQFTFTDCENLAYIPPGLFRNNKLAVNFYQTFANCVKAKVSRYIFCDGNVEDLNHFSLVSDVVVFSGAFWDVGSQLDRAEYETGFFPELWKYTFPYGVSSGSCFYNAWSGNMFEVGPGW